MRSHAKKKPAGTFLQGYITKESLLRFKEGGNGSRGTVPMHRKKSSVACVPVLILQLNEPQP